MTEGANPSADAAPVGPDNVITVAGELGRRSATVTSCGMSLVAGIGTSENNQTYLVPFFDCFGDMEIGEDEKIEPRAMLTFDNVAYLLGRLSAEYSDLLGPLSQMSSGELRPEVSRLRFAAEALETASRDLAEAARGLRDLEQPAAFTD